MPHCVYKIWSLKGDKVYYGSHTCDRDAKERYYQHVCHYRRNTQWQCSSRLLFDEYGVEDCLFQVVELCNTRKEAREREKWWILNHQCVNKMIPVPTEEETTLRELTFRLRTKERKKEYDATYRQKEERKIKHQCEVCGGSYVMRHKTTHEKTKLHMKHVGIE